MMKLRLVFALLLCLILPVSGASQPEAPEYGPPKGTLVIVGGADMGAGKRVDLERIPAH